VSNADLSFARKLLGNANSEPFVSTLDIVDNADTVANSLGFIDNSKIRAVALSPLSNVLNITGYQYSHNSAAISKITTAVNLNVRDASPSQAATLQGDTQVSAFSLAALASEVGATLPTLLGMSHLDHIDINADTTMAMTADQLDLVQDELTKLHGQYGLHINGVTMADLGTIAARADVFELQVTDTSEAIASGWDQLSGMAMGDQLMGITVTDSANPIAITYDQWNQSARALGQLAQGQSLAILDVSPDQATAVAGASQVAKVAVKGTADQVSAQFDDLIALEPKLDDIELTDDVALQLTQDQIDRGAAILAKINGGYDLEVIV